MYLVDKSLKALIDQSQKQGYLSFQQVDEYLPDEGGDPRMVDHLVLALEATGLDLIDDPPPSKKPAVAPDNGSNGGAIGTSPAMLSLVAPDTSVLSSRDPIRMYLSQMGNIPLLSRQREIFLAKQIELTRKRFRRTVLESDFALGNTVENARTRLRRRAALRTDAAHIRNGRRAKRADPGPHAA